MRRQGDLDSVYYKITDTTHISKVQMKRLLSHNTTKMKLTAGYLARKALEHAETTGKRFVVAWGSECEATHKDVTPLRSTHEEADTKILLHAVDTAVHGATEINIHSPDTECVYSVFATVSRALRRDEFYYWNRSESSSDQITSHRTEPRQC